MSSRYRLKTTGRTVSSGACCTDGSAGILNNAIATTVLKTGDQTIAGVKTFSTKIVGSIDSAVELAHREQLARKETKVRKELLETKAHREQGGRRSYGGGGYSRVWYPRGAISIMASA